MARHRRMRVLTAMSGGVDSSVAAALLLEPAGAVEHPGGALVVLDLVGEIDDAACAGLLLIHDQASARRGEAAKAGAEYEGATGFCAARLDADSIRSE